MLTVKILVLISIKFNFAVALFVLFCKDLMANAENSLVKLPQFFQNMLLSLHGMGQSVLENTIIAKADQTSRE